MKKIILKKHNYIQATLEGSQLQIKAKKSKNVIEIDLFETSGDSRPHD